MREERWPITIRPRWFLGYRRILAVAVIGLVVGATLAAMLQPAPIRAASTIPPVANDVGPASNAQCPPAGCLGKPGELGLPKVDTGNAVVDAINILSLLAGILSVIFLVLGGIRYTTSDGDPARVTSARQTITYAVIGLALSLIAPLIVAFVIVRGPH